MLYVGWGFFWFCMDFGLGFFCMLFFCLFFFSSTEVITNIARLWMLLGLRLATVEVPSLFYLLSESSAVTIRRTGVSLYLLHCSKLFGNFFPKTIKIDIY